MADLSTRRQRCLRLPRVEQPENRKVVLLCFPFINGVLSNGANTLKGRYWREPGSYSVIQESGWPGGGCLGGGQLISTQSSDTTGRLSNLYIRRCYVCASYPVYWGVSLARLTRYRRAWSKTFHSMLCLFRPLLVYKRGSNIAIPLFFSTFSENSVPKTAADKPRSLFSQICPFFLFLIKLSASLCHFYDSFYKNCGKRKSSKCFCSF